MNVDNIREAFSKAQTVITNNGITILYTYKDGWIDQEFTDDGKETLLRLIHVSDWVRLSFIDRLMFKLVFHNELDGQETVLFAPMQEENSLYGIENAFNAIRFDSDVCNEDGFFSFFDGCDLDDSDEVLERVQQLIDKAESEKPNVLQFEAFQRWGEFADIATRLASSLRLECELSRPGVGFDGSATMYLDYNTSRHVLIEGTNKELFERLVEISPVVMFECAVTKGYANFSFY